MTKSYYINRKGTLMEAEVQNSNKWRLVCFWSLSTDFVFMWETDIFFGHFFFFYVYAIYHCTVTPHDIKVYLCLYIGQTEDILSLNVLAL